MTRRFTQVKKGRWPSGIDKPIAVLRAEPDELAARYGLEFHAGSDELDRFREAALRLGSGRSVLLYRYERSPGIGTTVSIDGGDRAFEAFDEIAVALGVRKREFVWISDEAGSGPTLFRPITALRSAAMSVISDSIGSMLRAMRL